MTIDKTLLIAGLGSALMLCPGEMRAEGIRPLHVEGTVETRSAYLSRAKVVEDRPIQVEEVRLDSEAGPLGRFGFLVWNYSSLCNRRQHTHRRAFYEVDFAVYWKYQWEIAEDWTLANEAAHWWMILNGIRDGDEPTTYEWWEECALKNPYLTPSVQIRRGWEHQSWVYFKAGVSKPMTFAKIREWCGAGEGSDVWEQLTLSPGVFCELGSEPLFELRYGDQGRDYHAGAMAMRGSLKLTYEPCDTLSFYLSLEQFDLVDHDLRDRAHGINRRDLTFFTVGMNAHF